MAQVALQASAPTSRDASNAAQAINTPAGAADEQQIMFLTIYDGAAVPAPIITGWQKGGTATQGTNSLTAYIRAISTPVSAGTVTANFSSGVEIEAWAGSYNGSINLTAPKLITSFDPAKTIGVISALAANALQLFAGATARNPRQADTPTGFAERTDTAQYTAVGGLNLHVFERDVGAGDTAPANYDLRLTDLDGGGGGAQAGDQTLCFNVIIEEVAPANVASFDVLAEFPTIGITLTPSVSTTLNGSTVTFTPSVIGSNQGVTFSVMAGSGTITTGGVLTPTASGTVTVRATSVEAPAVFADASITVEPQAPAVNSLASGPSPRPISGTAEPDAEVFLVIDGAIVDIIDVDSQGNWAGALSLPDGVYSVFVSQISNRQQSAFTGPLSVTVQADVPDPLAIPQIFAIASGSGPRLISGSGLIGARVYLFINDEELSSQIIGAEGLWAFAADLEIGNYSAKTYQTQDGRASAFTAPVLFNVYAPIEPPPPPKFGARAANKITDPSGLVPKPPVSADDKPPPKLSAPFKTPRTIPNEVAKFPDKKS